MVYCRRGGLCANFVWACVPHSAGWCWVRPQLHVPLASSCSTSQLPGVRHDMVQGLYWSACERHAPAAPVSLMIYMSCLCLRHVSPPPPLT
jgi:hypothetical protein